MKATDFKKGDIYYSTTDNIEYISKFDKYKDNMIYDIAYLSQKVLSTNTKTELNSIYNIRLATPQEEAHLEVCIKAGKFVEAEPFEKKFIVGKWYKSNKDIKGYWYYIKVIEEKKESQSLKGECIRNNNTQYEINDEWTARESITQALELGPLTDLSEIQNGLPDNHVDKIKTMEKPTEFKKGEYIVYLGKNDDNFKKNHCFKIRETNDYLRPEIDCDGSTGNGWGYISYTQNKDYGWRYATQSEIDHYDSIDEPYDVTTLKAIISINNLIKGEIYAIDYEKGKMGVIMFDYLSSGKTLFYQYCTATWNTGTDGYQKNSTISNGVMLKSIRKPTSEEKKWLLACIEEDKFIPKEEAIKSKEFVLPEKWAIKITEDNINILNDFLHSNRDKYKEYISNWRVSNQGYHFHYPAISGPAHSSKTIKNGYTKITFEQFKKYILKDSDEVKPKLMKKPKFKYNRWYKDPSNKWMCYLSSKNTGYGFTTSGIWFSHYDGEWVTTDTQEASDEEVKERLFEEAKRRYPIGCKTKYIKGANFGKTTGTLKEYKINTFEPTHLSLRYHDGNNSVFYNGVWAEIAEQPKLKEKPMDWKNMYVKVTSEAENEFLRTQLGTLNNKDLFRRKNKIYIGINKKKGISRGDSGSSCVSVSFEMYLDQYGLNKDYNSFVFTGAKPSETYSQGELLKATYDLDEEWYWLCDINRRNNPRDWLASFDMSHSLANIGNNNSTMLDRSNSQVTKTNNSDIRILKDLGYEVKDNKFVKMKKARVVHCDTQDKWDFVFKMKGEDNYGKDICKKDTNRCLNVDTLSHGSISYYKREGYEILSFKEWLDEFGYSERWAKYTNKGYDGKSCVFVKSKEEWDFIVKKHNIDFSDSYEKNNRECIWVTSLGWGSLRYAKSDSSYTIVSFEQWLIDFGHTTVWEGVNKKSLLDIWLRETKAMNLSLEKLSERIRKGSETNWKNVYEKLEGIGNEKAKILFNKWNPNYQNEKPFKAGDKLVGTSGQYIIHSKEEEHNNKLGIPGKYFIADNVEYKKDKTVHLWSNGSYWGCKIKDVSFYEGNTSWAEKELIPEPVVSKAIKMMPEKTIKLKKVKVNLI